MQKPMLACKNIVLSHSLSRFYCSSHITHGSTNWV